MMRRGWQILLQVVLSLLSITALLGLVLLACYVSLGRIYMPRLAEQRPMIEAYLAEHMPFPVQFESLEGGWQQFSPIVELRGVKARLQVRGMHWDVAADSVSVEVDVLRSLFYRQVQLRDVTLHGGAVHVSGSPFSLSSDESMEDGALSTIIGQVLNLGFIHINKSTLALELPGLDRPLALTLDLALERKGDFRRLRTDIAFDEARSGRLQVILEARQSGMGELKTLQGYVHLEDFALNHWLHSVELHGAAPRLADTLSSETWTHWTRDGEMRAHGQLHSPALIWQVKDEKPLPALEQFAASFQVQREQGRLRFRMPHLDFTCAGIKPPLRTLAVDVSRDGQWQVATDRLDLPLARQLLKASGLANEEAQSILATLDPRGSLEPLLIDGRRREEGGGVPWKLRSQLHDVTVSPWRGAPGLGHVNGYMETTAEGGFVDLHTRDFTMAFPTVYANPMQFDMAQARVGWHIDPDRVTVESGLIELDSAEGRASGLLSLDLPHDPQHPHWMSLVIGLRDAPASSRNKYIPTVLSPALRQWLDTSIGEGHVSRGGFIFDGPLDGSRHPVVQLALDVDNTSLRFHEGWQPLEAIEGHLLVDDGVVSVHAPSARMYASAIRDARVQVAHDEAGHLQLGVQGELQGPASDVLRLLRESPLHHAIGTALDSWKASGQFAGSLDLQVPLDTHDEPVVHVTAALEQAQLQLPEQKLVFEHIHGPLEYHSDSGLQSPGLQGTLWGSPVQAHIRSARDEKGSRMDLQADGNLAMESFRQWMDWPWLRFAEGHAPVSAHIALHPTEPALLTLSSELKGITVNLPEPYQKAAGQPWALKATIPLGGTSPLMDFRVGPDLRVGVLHDDAGKSRVSVALGAVPFRVPQQPGITLYGRMPHFDWSQWQAPVNRMVEDLNPPDTATASAPLAVPEEVFRVSDLYVNALDAFGQHFTEVVASLRHRDRWWLGVQSADLAGDIGLSQQGGEPVLVNLRRLTLPSNVLSGQPDAAPGTPKPDPLRDVDWHEWPLMQVSIDHLKIGQQDMGQWNFHVTPTPQLLRIDHWHADSKALRIDNEGDGAWMEWTRKADGSMNTLLHATLLVRDVRSMLKALGFESSMSAEEAVLAVHLAWPHSPLALEATALEGNIGFRFTKGYLNTGNTAQTGLLKVFSVFNVNEILRRIRLDFADLYKDGLAFDDIKARIALHEGWLVIEEPVMIKGPASHFELQGQMDLVHDQLDNRLTVTLPVATSLPWLAALAGGLPAAAGVYIASKLVEKQVDSVTSLVYRVSGSINDPQIEFEKLFDTGMARFLPHRSGKPQPAEATLPSAAVPAPAGSPATAP